MERQKANADTLISELFRLLHLIYRIGWEVINKKLLFSSIFFIVFFFLCSLLLFRSAESLSMMRVLNSIEMNSMQLSIELLTTMKYGSLGIERWNRHWFSLFMFLFFFKIWFWPADKRKRMHFNKNTFFFLLSLYLLWPFSHQNTCYVSNDVCLIYLWAPIWNE